MEFVDIVMNCRGVAVALVGDDVNQHGSAVGGRVAEGALQGGDVVAVDGAAVLEPQRLEDRGRDDELFEGLLDPLGGLVGGVADEGEMAQGPPGRVLGRLVNRGKAQLAQVLGDASDGGSVGAPVVVEDDDELGLQVADVVEGLVGHAPGEGAVTDDAHDLARLAGELAGRGQGQRVAEARGSVRVLHDVVLGLRARRVAGEPAALAQGVEAAQTAGQHLVHVGLVTGVEDQSVPRRVEDPVQGHGQLDDTEVGSEVAAGPGHRLDEEGADLAAESIQVVGTQAAKILRSSDLLEQHEKQSSPRVMVGPAL